MPSLKTILPLESDRYYHIFNRGNNYSNIFFTDANYKFFLKRLNEYLGEYIEILAYSLMPNHFHLLIKTKYEILVEDEVISDSEQVGKIISEQFRRLFLSYAMAINKQEQRSGSLFLKIFKRIEIDSDDYIKRLTFYIHYNPEKHKYIDDFKAYKFSSYKAYLLNKETKLNKQLTLEIFQGLDEFIEYHKAIYKINIDDKLTFE